MNLSNKKKEQRVKEKSEIYLKNSKIAQLDGCIMVLEIRIKSRLRKEFNERFLVCTYAVEMRGEMSLVKFCYSNDTKYIVPKRRS